MVYTRSYARQSTRLYVVQGDVGHGACLEVVGLHSAQRLDALAGCMVGTVKEVAGAAVCASHKLDLHDG